ncbi:DUF6625 family protein [Mucilaginibacter xinganensis]|uniref:Glycosyl transferase n=1 Tax=Mucilaginibacter xinganensis TaxID=1234841 RepID=A0A223NU04_9SPHI|nr:DUF6625 family protein [Mucilaginibacter xinganensis]ASU33379.1 hypothetical protein MuYL_1481 [Mucilaginibacter xinganensis]
MPEPVNKYKIALITCYFGQAPWYFKLFLKSCAYNPGVHFYVIGDLEISHPLPENVYHVSMNISEFETLASQKLAMPVNVANPYKLCDLKPAYGVIFDDFLMNYDFWGHGDLDVIFGDIRGFITNKILDSYEVICVREEYITGFFSLFKNIPFVNELFKLSKDHRKVFTSADHYCFDECNFAWIPLMEGLSIFDIKTPIESMTHIVKKLAAEGKIKAHFNFMVIEGLCGQMEWNTGSLYYANKAEAILYHLIKFKKQPDLIKPQWDVIPDIFFIERNYFLKNDPASADGLLETQNLLK